MSTLSKFDLLWYLSQIENPTTKKLEEYIKRHIAFEKTKPAAIRSRIRGLIKDGTVTKNLTLLENEKTINCLAFIFWSKLRSKDYNIPLNTRATSIFKAVFEKTEAETMEIIKETGLSRPTVQKTIKILAENSFFQIKKKKPIIARANLNDLTFFYTNFLNMQFNSFLHRVDVPNLPNIQSKILEGKLIQLHVYSTTVTEGNTALQEDVKKVFENRPVSLTPIEVEEILNAKKAIELLYTFYKEKITIEKIKILHKAITNNILDSAGNMYYGKKRVVGSEYIFPSSKNEIDIVLSALLNFIEKYEKKISPLILAPILHFIFVSIHPFADGNGRVARLLHSWILLRAGYPLFVFDPNRRNKYFDLIEEGRRSCIDSFIQFCLEEHFKSITDLIKQEKAPK